MLKKIIKGVQNRLARYRTYYKYKNILGHNLELKDKFKGKRCFIIASGPSVKDQDLLRLVDEETFIVNTFWRHPLYDRLKAKNYVDLDPGPPNQKSFFYREELVQREKDLRLKHSRFFFHLTGFYEYFKKLNVFSADNAYYIHSDGFFKGNLAFNTDITKTVPQVKNVIIGCILIAVYMGFEEIYLLGCEHSFLAYRQFEEAHFFKETAYTNSKDQQERMRYGMIDKSYEGVIDQAKVLFQNYRLLNAKLSKTHPQVKIYNATPNSFLDVFPFVKYEDIKI